MLLGWRGNSSSSSRGWADFGIVAGACPCGMRTDFVARGEGNIGFEDGQDDELRVDPPCASSS